MTLSLEALDYSRPVEALFAQEARTGYVHSIFPQALNIAVDDRLFVLLSTGASRMPNSVHLPARKMEQLYAKMRPGKEVRVGDGRLFIAELDLLIHLPDKAAWEPVPAITAQDWQRARVTAHAYMLAHHLAQRAQQDGLAHLVKPLLLQQATWETPLARIALPLLRLLVRASREQDVAGLEKAAQGLAGLGPGLTPSGDDTLGGFIGVMAVLSFQAELDNIKVKWGWTPTRGVPTCGHTLPPHTKSDRSLATIIADAARVRTTLLSATLLAHASRGEVAEHVGELLLALAGDESKKVPEAAERVLAYGACSGGDTLLGVLLGLQVAGGNSTNLP